MMPYQVFQLYQAERTKTVDEVRRADERLGEFSRALSSTWRHAARPSAPVLRALPRAVAVVGSGLARLAVDHGPARRPRRARHLAPRRKAGADYLVDYRPCFPSGRPSACCDRSGQRGG